MWKKFVSDFQNIFDTGEYIDEKETEVLQNSFYYLRLLKMSPKKGEKLTKLDFLEYLIITFPFCILLAASDLVVQFSTRKYFILDDFLQAVTVVCSGANMYITLAWFLYKNQDIANLAINIGNFRQFRKPRGFDRANRIANFVTTAMIAYTISGVCVFALTCYQQRDTCLRENAEMKIERICGLLTPSPLPTYFNYGAYFVVLAIAQFYFCMVVCIGAAVVLTFTCGLVVVISSRIQQLKSDMRSAFQATNDFVRKQKLKKCVQYHVHMIKMMNQLNDCMSVVCFVQSIFMCAVIALISFQFLMQPELRTLVHGFGWFLVLAIFSYGGQIMIDESVDIPMQIYDNEWFEFDVETQIFVLMIILKGNYFFYLDTILFGPLALTTFSQVIQNAYSIIAILYQNN